QPSFSAALGMRQLFTKKGDNCETSISTVRSLGYVPGFDTCGYVLCKSCWQGEQHPSPPGNCQWQCLWRLSQDSSRLQCCKCWSSLSRRLRMCSIRKKCQCLRCRDDTWWVH